MRPVTPYIARALAATALAAAALAGLQAADREAGSARGATMTEPGPRASAAARGFSLATRSFKMGRPNEKRRLLVRCPGRQIPLGGGMRTDPPLRPDGEGVYPHSYERLGVQSGWHITAVLYDPSPGSTRSFRVTLQVVCTANLGHMTPPHVIKDVKPGQVTSAVARCPGRRHLIGGGFQRTNWVARGGNYATESRLLSSKRWRVTGGAFGGFGGELVSIGYCQRSRRPLLSTVSGSVAIDRGEAGTAVSRKCPRKRRLVFGGFSSSPAGAVLIGPGTLRRNGSFAVTAYNRFGPRATVRAHGYCLKR